MPLFESTDALSRVIQAALTPAFLLAGLATIIAALSQRLGRVSDRVDSLAAIHAADPAGEARRRYRLARLRTRSQLLDTATILSAAAGIGVAMSVAALFIASLRHNTMASWSFWLFLAALACLTLALLLFAIEVLMAGRDLRMAARPDTG